VVVDKITGTINQNFNGTNDPRFKIWLQVLSHFLLLNFIEEDVHSKLFEGIGVACQSSDFIQNIPY
jgi:hypothetical protein